MPFDASGVGCTAVIVLLPHRARPRRCTEGLRAPSGGWCTARDEGQWHTWRQAVAYFQTGVTAYVTRDDVTESRYEIEQAVKRAVRHADEDPVE